MIIVGLYGDTFEFDDLSSSKLSSMHSTIRQILPKRIGLHILPFFPNTGDGGFAPDDWLVVRDDLGSWEDIGKLSADWNIIVDGIYNHVGLGHRWVKCFYDRPDDCVHILHAYKVNSSDEGPLSPRGYPVLNKASGGYHLWQTFSKVAVDVRLDSDVVQNEIELQLSKFIEYGIWGVRLDGVAYYSKSLGSNARHNPGVYDLANMMVDKVRSKGLHVWAQLDCDDDAMKYFSDLERKDIPVNDFSFSAYLAIAMIANNPDILASHVNRTLNTKKILIRAPRTHDGIYLRSGRLLGSDLTILTDFAQVNNMDLRIVNGHHYELNCSAPYLYMKIARNSCLSTIINFTIAVTGFMPGWSYYYLPYILGFIPESLHKDSRDEDPRSLNRKKIPIEYVKQHVKSQQYSKLKRLLSILGSIRKEQDNNFTSIIETSKKLLIIITPDRKYKLIANFNDNNSYQIDKCFLSDYILDSSSYEAPIIGPWGFVILRSKHN